MKLKNLGIIFIFLFSINAAAQTIPDADPKIVSSPNFILSDAAEAKGIFGKLTVHAVVDTSGELKNSIIFGQLNWPCGTNPKKELGDTMDAIRENLKGVRFSPAIKNGKPNDAEVSFTFAVGQTYRNMVKEREAEGSATRPKIVETGTITGRALSLPKPGYPPTARSQRAAGPVGVQVLIDEQGKVISAGVLSGNPVFYSSAREAACDARFAPTMLHGSPVKVSGVITYNFVP